MTKGTFTNSDLSNGVLTIVHGQNLTAPFQIFVAIFDGNNQQVFPDQVIGDANDVRIDLTSIQQATDDGEIIGTWGWILL